MLAQVKAAIPRVVKQHVKQVYQDWQLARAIKQLQTTGPTRVILQQLRAAWGNEGFSADVSFLQAIAEHVQQATGPILECGAGVSTLVAGVCAAKRGLAVLSLEQDAIWATSVQARTAFLSNVTVLYAPLFNHWYDVRNLSLPHVFDLALCDGPAEFGPGFTGYECRVGLLSTVPHIKTILVDDADCSTEVLARWQRDYAAHVDLTRSEDGAYAVVSLSG